MQKSLLPSLDEATHEAVRATAVHLAEMLGETETGPRTMLWRLVRAVGITEAQTLLEATQRLEAAGGMLTADQSRRRTMGGVYFYLARQFLKGQPAFAFVFPYASQHKASVTSPAHSTPAASPSVWSWEDRQTAIAEALSASGGSTSMKVTLIGRPGKIIERGDCIITAMPTMQVPSLPKGLPVPDTTSQTLVLVYIAKKHYRKVAEALQQPEDVLIVEGFGVYDPQIKGMALLASNVTTRSLQQAKRQPTTS